MIRVTEESCEMKEKSPCKTNSTYKFGPKDVQDGNLFSRFNEIWKEEGDPMKIKREQLKESFWDTKVPNILNTTWERPLIKRGMLLNRPAAPCSVRRTSSFARLTFT